MFLISRLPIISKLNCCSKMNTSKRLLLQKISGRAFKRFSKNALPDLLVNNSIKTIIHMANASLHRNVVNHMMENDYFSQWMGVKVIEVKEGYSRIGMTIRKEMVNGFGIVHGGIPFSLADSAFAFACNNRNN